MPARDRRPAAVAGTWYPGAATALVEAVDGHVRGAADGGTPCPRAIVSPHAGLRYSGPVAAHAYRAVRTCAVGAVVLVGPSHFVPFRGVAVWRRGAWETPLGVLTIEEGLASQIARESPVVVERADAHAREHSLEMQLPFVARLLPGVPIVPVLMGQQDRATVDAFGRALAGAVRAWEDETGRTALLVASSDLSHYEDAATAARLDGLVAARIEVGDADGLMDALEDTPGHACGGGPIVAVMRASAALGARHARVLNYADSGDVTGDKSSVVGYLAAALW